MTIYEINRLLAQEYGAHHWHRHRDPLSELILTILSQNTTDSNCGAAFSSLLATFGDWEAVAEGDVAQIAQAIRCGGLSQIKAARIKLILQQIQKKRGSLDLEFLASLPLPQIKAWLQQLPGVGPKTAACVLLFSLEKPALPVDTHIYRVARRLGLIDSKVSVERAHDMLEGLVPSESIYEFHLNMIEHGRRICHVRNPKCGECVLREGCTTTLK